jgi:hypothetical protein
MQATHFAQEQKLWNKKLARDCTHPFLHLKQQEDGDKFQDNMELEAKVTRDQHVSPYD